MPLSINFEQNGLNLQNEYKWVDFWDLDSNLVLAKFLEKYKRFPVFAVSWPAWAWKSTFTKAIAKYYWAEIFRELPELNPFLGLIWKTKDKINDSLWYPNQTFFCSTDSAIVVDGFINAMKRPVVFDFAITQTKAFWDLKLTWAEKENFTKMFENIFYGGGEGWFWWLPKPDLVIEIRADDESIIKRREARGKRVDSVFVDEVWKMNELYRWWFLWNYFENVVVFDNSQEITQEELTTKINEFLVSLVK